MILLVYSDADPASIQAKLGLSDYSYWFVLRAFRPLLERLGTVIFLRDPAREAPYLAAQFQARGEACAFLGFAPPDKATLGLPCPAIPVFAWEFDSLPDEDWRGNPNDDWRVPLRRAGRAITHSGHAVAVTRRAMGAGYEITSIPAPVWDGFAARFPLAAAPPTGVHRLHLRGRVVDTAVLDLASYSPVLRRAGQHAALPPEGGHAVTLSGTVYATVLNPVDSRKNVYDLLAGFIWALRDQPDATLVIKLTHWDSAQGLHPLLEDLAKHAPFQCRVVVLAGYLDDASYDALVAAAAYVVNASHGEGQCLPLMEFMSAGKPAIAPLNTAMLDYIDESCAFPVDCAREPCGWPHDERMVYRTLRWRIDFGSLVAAYAESYRVAAHCPARWAAMAAAARAALQRHCAQAVALPRLAQVLGVPAPA